MGGSMSYLHDISLIWIISASVMLGIVIGLVIRGDKARGDEGCFSEYDHERR
jgi:hypothetical protein